MNALTMHQPVSVPIGKLRRAEYNPRILPKEERVALRKSLRAFGFVQPVVARAEDYELIGGHQRIDVTEEVLVEDGYTREQVAAVTVPVVLVPNLSDAQARALNLALNRISGEWDYAKLADIFTDLGELPEVALTGFTDHEIKDVLAALDAMGPDLTEEPEADDAELDAQLEASACKFNIVVATMEEAALVRETLTRFGMTGPKHMGAAMVALCKAATEAELAPATAPESKRKKGSK